MPFTFSHPAAVLPIHARFKKWIPLSALVVGSMVPDAAYYLPMPEHFKRHSHSLLGTFSTSLPLGILALLVFYWMAAPLVSLLPSPHREALQPELKPPPDSIRQALLVALGIVVGAWTHVLWDSFTHRTGWIVMHGALLQRRYFENLVTGYNVLQYLSTVLGLGVLLYAYDRWMKASGFQPWAWRKPCWRLYLWLGVFAVCFVAATLESHTIQAIASQSYLYSKHFGLVFIISFVRDMLIAVCAVAIGAKVLGLRGRDARQPPEVPART
jgi:hypothetical protein